MDDDDDDDENVADEEDHMSEARFLSKSLITDVSLVTHSFRFASFSAKKVSTTPYLVLSTNPFWPNGEVVRGDRSICSLN